MPENTLIQWSDVLKTGIEEIDGQHKQLVDLTNELYRSCLDGFDTQNVFKDIMGRMVEYVKFHFSAEMVILERIKFPESADHKKQHDELIVKILDAAKDSKDGTKFVPNNFVRTLKDWIVGHIAVYDKAYALFIADQRRKGLLSDARIG
jgi:hemerythrin